MSKTIPIFTTDASLGRSILTTDEADKIKDDYPVSVFSIAKEHNIDKIYMLETSMVSFINSYKNAAKINKQLIFGIRFKVVDDSKNQSEESLQTESNVCVWMKNSNGYKDLVKLYSEGHGRPDRFYYTGRLDWKLLQEMFTENLLLSIPFYSSFIANNTLNYGYNCVPNFGKIKPIFTIENHNLPFDSLLKTKTSLFCEANKFDLIDTHSIYYYKTEDIKAYQVFKCIHERSTYEMPNLRFMSQPTFSFEGWRKNNG